MSERVVDVVIERRPYEPDGPTYIPLRLSGTAREPAELALSVQIPGPGRALVVRTWDDRDPVIGPVARHAYGLGPGRHGATHTARLAWSCAYEVTLADGGRFPPGTHAELRACDPHELLGARVTHHGTPPAP